MTPDQLPPLPKCDIFDPNRFGVGWREASLTAYGLQCAEAAVERERARIIAGVDQMSAQCRELRREADKRGDDVGARCMTNRCQELAMVYGLVNHK